MYLVYRQGGDWTAWLVIGPIATVLVVVMVTVTYGLARRSGAEEIEAESVESPEDQEHAGWSPGYEALGRDVRVALAITQEVGKTVTTPARQSSDRKQGEPRTGPKALIPRHPIQIARAVLFLSVLISLLGPWYTTDFGDIGAGWILAADMAGWTCGLCCVPYLWILLLWPVVILTPIREKMPIPYQIMLWTYRGVLLVWLVQMTTGFFTASLFKWEVLSWPYWGPKLFTVGIGLAIAVELVAIATGLLRKLRAPAEVREPTEESDDQ
jgi:hypothetical protein